MEYTCCMMLGPYLNMKQAKFRELVHDCVKMWNYTCLKGGRRLKIKHPTSMPTKP